MTKLRHKLYKAQAKLLRHLANGNEAKAKKQRMKALELSMRIHDEMFGYK